MRPIEICLISIAYQGQAHQQQTLLSSLPFIDHWIVLDVNLPEQDAQNIENLLSSKPGKLVQKAWCNESDALNFLICAAKEIASHALLVLPGEQLFCSQADINLAPNEASIWIDKNFRDFSQREPRIFNLSSVGEFTGAAKAKLSNNTLSAENYNRHVVINQIDKGDQYYLSDILSTNLVTELIAMQHADSPTDLNRALELAKHHLSSNRAKKAYKVLEELNSLDHNNVEVAWQCTYLLGALNLNEFKTLPDLQIDQKQDLAEQTVDFFQACFELDPNRIEPLFRLAQLYQFTGQLEQAAELCELVVSNQGVSSSAEYFEPRIYRLEGLIYRAELALLMNDGDSFEKAMDSIMPAYWLNKPLTQRLEKLKHADKTNLKFVSSKTSLPQKLSEQSAESIKPIESKPPKLTIGMATFDDFDGVYFTINSILLYHKAAHKDIEILVIDNNPSSKHGEEVRKLCNTIPLTRYIAANEYKGTAVRERIFAEAQGEYVLCVDCHVFLHEGAISRLLDYFYEHPNTANLLHGPMVNENGNGLSTHMDPRWQDGFYGVFNHDERGKELDAPEFDIPAHGLALMACKKSAWPGFNLKFRGFGGEEGYLHEKVRQRGDKTLCLPFLRWTHRFPRPNGVNYVNRWEDRIRNYLIGWDELSLNKQELLDHYRELVGIETTASCLAGFKNEKASPFWVYDSIFLLSENEQPNPKSQQAIQSFAMSRVIQVLGLDQFEDYDCAVRHILDSAIRQSLPKVLILLDQEALEQSLVEHASLLLQNSSLDKTKQSSIKHQNMPLLQMIPESEYPNFASGDAS